MKNTTTKKANGKYVVAIAGIVLSLALPLSAAAADAAKPAAQTYSIESTISELLANPKAKAVVEKYLPELSKSSSLSMIEGMALQDLAAFPQSGLDDAKLKAIQAELSQVK